MSIEVESTDIIRLILQFLDEQGLGDTRQALESETSIKLNTVTNKQDFTQDIIQGKWDTVLQKVVTLNVRPKALIDLYEQVVLELAELRELGAARSLLRQSQPMYLLKQQHPERYLHLEHVLSRSIFDPQDVYRGHTKEKRRQKIAQDLSDEVSVAAPSRLLTLLDQSAQWQQQQGLCVNKDSFNAFGGGFGTGLNNSEQGSNALTEDTTMEQQVGPFAGTRFKSIKIPGKSAYAECMTFSLDGHYLATGSVDGFIEIWNPQNGKRRKDLRYQAEGNFMAMDESVISMVFSKEGDLLISGSTDGKIAVWKVQSGFCKRRISPAHSQGVTSLDLNTDSTQILSASYDKLIKIHEIKSGKLLKEFQGHTSFINSVAYINDGSNILSGSSDGTIKIWDTESTQCIKTLSPSGTVLQVLPWSSMDGFVACTKDKQLALYSRIDWTLVKSFALPDTDTSSFISATISPRSGLIYGITEAGMMYGFDAVTGDIMGSIEVSEKEIIAIANHPVSSIVAVNDSEGNVYLFKP